ncbi:GntR family transcriptional regulator, partial [Rhizobium ruizarguesonis]
LKESYETSISTLREVLNRLSSEGLVVAEGQKGFEVSPVSVSDLKETAALRLLLETHALQVLGPAGVAGCHHLFHPRQFVMRR